MAPLNGSDVSPGYVNPSVPSSNTVVVFTPYERKGAIAMGMAALISCTMVSILLLYIIMSALLLRWQRQPIDSSAPFIKKQIAVFVICLFVADLAQSISGVLQLKWAVENGIYEGISCTAQAALLTMGDLGSTVWSCVIAFHTFSCIALGKQWSRLVVYVVVITGWSFVGILSLIGPTALENLSKGPFYGIAGGWCFITSNYSVARLGIHYIPLFCSAIIIIVLYGLLFLVLLGSVNFMHHVERCPPHIEQVILRERITIAKRMLWYPVAFLVCIFPIATIRLVGMHNSHIPDRVWTFGLVVLFLLGSIDSVIYATTRRVIKPFSCRSPLPVRRWSLDASTAHSDSGHPCSPRKSEFSDHSTVDKHRSVDAPPDSPWEKEPPKQTEESNGAGSDGGTVQVTFERISEVR